jgi:hypothetical protein
LTVAVRTGSLAVSKKIREWPAVRTSGLALAAPSCLRVCDPGSGPRRFAREVLPSGCGRRAREVVDGVVGVELALGPARHQVKDAEVQVVHDRASPGSGTGSETTAAWGSE